MYCIKHQKTARAINRAKHKQAQNLAKRAKRLDCKLTMRTILVSKNSIVIQRGVVMLFKTQNDVKKALQNGNKVFWQNRIYYVKTDKLGRLLVICKRNSYAALLRTADLPALFIN